MNSLSPWLLAYLLNSLWQVAAIALAAALATRLMNPAGVRARHLLAIAALLAAIALPACSAVIATANRGGKVEVKILTLAQTAGAHNPAGQRIPTLRRHTASLQIAPAIATSVTLLYLAFLLYRAGILLYKWRATRNLLRNATPLQLPAELALPWRRWKQSFKIGEVRLLASTRIAGPVTLGLRHAALLVPPDFLVTATREELAAALCHELAHIARRDFLINLLLELASLPLSFHPALWLLKAQVDESRELVCDAAAARASTGAGAYARSLLSLAQTICAAPAAAPLTNALGIFEANILEKRIMRLIDRQPAPRRAARLLSLVAGASVLAAATLAISLFALQPATAQSGYQPWLGTWKTTINGQPAVYVELLDYQGKLTGSVSNGDFGMDEKNGNAITGWHYGTPGGAPIVEASISGQTLRFKTLDNGGPLPWELTITAPGKAELRIAEALPNGSKMPAIAAVRDDSKPASDDPKPAVDENPRQDSNHASEDSTPPHVIHSVNPEYTPQARAAKLSGICVVSLVIDRQGFPTNVQVTKPLGLGLDENAVKAVQQYRFTPATKDGVPIAKQVHIEVNFQFF